MPLKGIKVIELGGLAPGPFCGKILRDFGATVIKVDKFYEDFEDIITNGKKSLALDMKSEEGVQILKKLSNVSDVLIDPYRKGVLEKLGLGPSVLLESNPRLIYARLSGFGQNGYYSSMAGHDINYLSLTGLLSMYGWRASSPAPPCNFSEFAGGSLVCVMGILIGLIDRNRTGVGQVIDSNIVEGVSYVGSWLLKARNTYFTHERGNNWLDGGTHFYDVYETKDGKFVSVGALEPKFYAQLISILGFSDEEVPQLGGDFKESREVFAKKFKQKTRDEWCKIFDLSDACVAPVLTPEEVHLHRHNAERKSFVKDEEGNTIAVPAPRLSRHNYAYDSGAPCTPGQHTYEILAELGYSLEEIERLKEKGVVRGSQSSKL